MKGLSRRAIMAATAAGGAAIGATVARAASFGNPDLPPQGAVNVTNPNALTIPGPHDPALAEHHAHVPRSAADRCRQHAGVLGVV